MKSRWFACWLCILGGFSASVSADVEFFMWNRADPPPVGPQGDLSISAGPDERVCIEFYVRADRSFDSWGAQVSFDAPTSGDTTNLTLTIQTGSLWRRSGTGEQRFDMPRFQPRAEYVREMRRYGILPADAGRDKPIDVYATDRAYWQSLWYQPSSRSDASFR